MFSFEKLDTWQYARSFASDVYRIVESFPRSERFALSQQLHRAAVSVVANIAEGSSRSSRKDFSRYLELAFGSLCEVIAEMFIALDHSYVTKEAFDELYMRAEALGRMLSRLRASLSVTKPSTATPSTINYQPSTERGIQ